MSVIERNRVDDLDLFALGQEVEHVVRRRELGRDAALIAKCDARDTSSRIN